ncbi:MAG: 8-oxo-dGTP diphosphatase [Flavobacterium sp.]|jgi:8-oxo-dGTP diphosphatase
MAPTYAIRYVLLYLRRNTMTPHNMLISNIDWPKWQAEERATLMFVQKEDQVLLIHKKRGLGAGNINGPGGRIELNESPMQCAVRETEEELCITPLGVAFAGELFFHSEDMPRLHGYVFTASDYTGVPCETDEAIPLWTNVNEIPFDKMWQDDQYWLPQVLLGKTITGWFSFEKETLLDYKVEVRKDSCTKSQK